MGVRVPIRLQCSLLRVVIRGYCLISWLSPDASSRLNISTNVCVLVSIQGLLVLLEQGNTSDLLLTIRILVEQKGGRFGVLGGVHIGPV